MSAHGGVSKVNSVCKAALRLTDTEIAEAEQMAKDQDSFIHPLKHGKQAKLNTLGRGNLKIIEALRKLRAAIIATAPAK